MTFDLLCNTILVALFTKHWYTQGVLAFKFPISILMWTWGQYRCQMFCKIMKNYVPISDFATRQLNLRKSQKSQKFSKKTFFLSLKNAIVIKGGLFQCTLSASLLFGLQKIFFDPK